MVYDFPISKFMVYDFPISRIEKPVGDFVLVVSVRSNNQGQYEVESFYLKGRICRGYKLNRFDSTNSRIDALSLAKNEESRLIDLIASEK